MKTLDDLVFLNIATQKDFIEPPGSLYIQNAEKIRKNLGKLTKLAKRLGDKIINIADRHVLEDSEISEKPDHIKTFPAHCIIGTEGAEFISETNPIDPYVIGYEDQTFSLNKLLDSKEIVIYKNDSDVFKGNPHAREIFECLNPKRIVVYGVDSNVCVEKAIQGLLIILPKTRIYLPVDAVKELQNLPSPYKRWQEQGVQLTTLQGIYELTGKRETCLEI